MVPSPAGQFGIEAGLLPRGAAEGLFDPSGPLPADQGVLCEDGSVRP